MLVRLLDARRGQCGFIAGPSCGTDALCCGAPTISQDSSWCARCDEIVHDRSERERLAAIRRRNYKTIRAVAAARAGSDGAERDSCRPESGSEDSQRHQLEPAGA